MLRRRTKLIWLTGALFAVCAAIMVAALIRGPRQEIRFTPPPFDEAAVQGVPGLTLDDGYGSIDASVYQFSVLGEISLADGRVEVFFTNYAQNNAWLKLVMKDTEGNKLGETGLLRPGEYVQYLALELPPAQSMPVTMVIMGYEPDTYYSVGNVSLQTQLSV